MQTLLISQAPSVGSDVSFKARTIKNQFGDGYRQTAKDGLNALQRSWQLKWDQLSIDSANYLEQFLTDHIGMPFYYTLPRELVARAWDCETFSRGAPAGGYDTFSATFEQRFDLA